MINSTLRQLAQDPEVVERARDRSALIRLWDVCQTPDFRKVAAEEHVRLVKDFFFHLTGGRRRVPEDWIALQDEYECFFMIADWHALTSEWMNPGAIPKNVREVAADWIACGIDPEKSCVFIQSEVPEHLELNMILSCLTPLGWLERVPTYKEAREQLGYAKPGEYVYVAPAKASPPQNHTAKK